MELEQCTRKSHNRSVYLSAYLSIRQWALLFSQSICLTIYLPDSLTPSPLMLCFHQRLVERETHNVYTHRHTRTHKKEKIYKK